jgi:hypothetical protein
MSLRILKSFSFDQFKTPVRATVQVLLVIKASYFFSMARRRNESVRVAWMEVGTGESGDDEVADNMSLSAGSPTSPTWSSDES